MNVNVSIGIRLVEFESINIDIVMFFIIFYSSG